MFFEFGIKDIIDIVLVALMLFYIYRLMKESRSLNVFMGILIFVVLWLVVSQVLEMKLLGSIMDKLVSVGVIALIILFQEDIRKFLYNLGAHQRVQTLRRLFASNSTKQTQEQVKQTIMPVVMSCLNMSKKKVGALIVIQRATPLDDTYERIRAAGCILPVSHDLHIPKELGLRHRAALGITHESDCIAIVVSEETGGISVAIRNKFQLRLTAEKLESILTQELA